MSTLEARLNMPPDELGRFLGSGAVAPSILQQVADAIKQEWRVQRRTYRLQALGIRPIGHEADCLYRIVVPRFGDMDWTWEGAKAFRPRGADGIDYSWAGEVVEVDESEGVLFVRTEPEGLRPVAGMFLVTPFDFLEALKAVYCDHANTLEQPLREGLAASSNAVKSVALACPAGTDTLDSSWSRSVGILWGPPGTGKTYRIGEQVARALTDPTERILVVSTTNQATDNAALSIGAGMIRGGASVERNLVSRVGAGADIVAFRRAGLEEILVGGEAWLRERLSGLLREHARLRDPERRAPVFAEIQRIRQQLASNRRNVADVDSRVVVATAFTAMRDLATPEGVARAARAMSRFSTIIIDEAGLISRATAAALSLYGARRLYLVGDPRQLSPISRISRVLPQAQARWIASSALDGASLDGEGVTFLREQYRMHPHIREAVSTYQYDGRLRDAAQVISRPQPIAVEVADGHRALWYVLDEDTDDLARIRAERGPGNKSWVRSRTGPILERLFRAHPELARANGLFISPFAAQARSIGEMLAQVAPTWKSSTTHRQQGAEADLVVVDTVNATSTAWQHQEWKRLVNVSISRARHLLIVLASRAEMTEPFLAPLAGALRPTVLRGIGGQLRWVAVAEAEGTAEVDQPVARPDSLGAQLESRKALRPILSAEQQRLCAYGLDGKPRLVRGVAGSGKTAVLANWLVRWIAEQDESGPYWVVYANAALQKLLKRAIGDAWKALGRVDAFPWHAVQLFHVLELLEVMEKAAGVQSAAGNPYDFEARSRVLLARDARPACKALFIDEAQDFGEATIQYLTRLVIQTGPGESDRAVNIFFDNAQNVYRRGTPKWSQLGLDMRGRSTVMKESFRSTRPITEFALNTLYRLQPPADDPDHRELVERDLIEAEVRNGRPFWRVRFNSVDGPAPDFRRFTSRDAEIQALCARVLHWVSQEHVSPRDIRVIANDRTIRRRVVSDLAIVLSPLGIRVEEQARATLDNEVDAILVTTAQSFKGHESEIVVVPAADKFTAMLGDEGKGVLSASLYVAMTRARSVLYVSSIERAAGSPSAPIVAAARESLEDLLSPPAETPACSPGEVLLEYEAILGEQHRSWLREISESHELLVGPILEPDGAIIAEPLFCIETAGARYACFASSPSQFTSERLGDAGVGLLTPGEPIE